MSWFQAAHLHGVVPCAVSLCPRRCLCVLVMLSDILLFFTVSCQSAFIATIISAVVLSPSVACSVVHSLKLSSVCNPTLLQRRAVPELSRASNRGHRFVFLPVLLKSHSYCSPEHKNVVLLVAATDLLSHERHFAFRFHIVLVILLLFLASLRVPPAFPFPESSSWWPRFSAPSTL